MTGFHPHMLTFSASRLRQDFNIRFHHFCDINGRLVATIVSKPFTEAGDVVSVAAAIASKKDAATRRRGREIALGRLLNQNSVTMSLDLLKEQITNRTVLANFSGGKRLKLRPRLPFKPRKAKETLDDCPF